MSASGPVLNGTEVPSPLSLTPRSLLKRAAVSDWVTRQIFLAHRLFGGSWSPAAEGPERYRRGAACRMYGHGKP